MLHPLLRRQLRKAGLAEESGAAGPAWMAFLQAVHRSYTQADDDRALLERSLQLSSTEMRALYERVALQNDELEIEVAQRTAELAAAREADRRRMDQLEEIVDARTRELRHAALHDRLTHLPNRALFYDRLHQAILRRARQPDSRFSVLFIDFDRFKLINDSLGHEYGDRLLRAIAQRLTETLRESDSVARLASGACMAARLGGDEFCVLLTDLNSDADAGIVAGRLLRRLSEPYQLEHRSVAITASIGITHGSLGYRSAEDMLRDADIAMYRAKNAGKDRFVVFDQTMHENAIRRLVMENDLRQAAERGELALVYQPIVSLTTGSFYGAEALLRWRHPQHGPISPVDFIPLAEETGTIWEIGAWALRGALAQHAAWKRSAGGSPIRTLSVNVSQKQLADPRLTKLVLDSLLQYQVPAHDLVLEITETAVTANPDVALKMINSLRGLGVRVYLDDFGTGYSSLGLLHRFPLDGLKLDRRFLEESESRRRTAACIHSVVTLVRALEMELVAEGIEALEQVALLQAMNCERGQGFLFARPVEAEEIPHLAVKPFRPPQVCGQGAARQNSP